MADQQSQHSFPARNEGDVQDQDGASAVAMMQQPQQLAPGTPLDQPQTMSSAQLRSPACTDDEDEGEVTDGQSSTEEEDGGTTTDQAIPDAAQATTTPAATATATAPV